MRPEAVIFDVDGTLADVSGIRHYVSLSTSGWTGRKNLTAFHSAASWINPHTEVIEAARSAADSAKAVLVVTAWMQTWAYQTRVWLQKWGVPFDRLYMRMTGDPRPDYAGQARDSRQHSCRVHARACMGRQSCHAFVPSSRPCMHGTTILP